MSVVSNTSPLTNLAAIAHFGLLRELYGELHIAEAVWRELNAYGQVWPGRDEVADANWIHRHRIQNRALVTALREDLDAGEAETIALAVELNADMMLMDEREGRHAARRFGFKPAGVVGVLLEAKADGQIPFVRPLLDKLRREAGFYLGDGLYCETVFRHFRAGRILSSRSRYGSGDSIDSDRIHSSTGINMQEQLAVLEHITACLERAGIAYMLSGSVAMNYYAQPRMTRDIDMVIELQVADVQRLGEQLGDDYYFDEDMAQAAIAQEGMFNILHHASLLKIDCIVRKNHVYRREEFSRRRQMVFGGFPVWIVSAEDLVLSKLYWLKDSRSEMQFKDIANLIAGVPDLDWTYLRHWAQALEISALLEEVAQ